MRLWLFLFFGLFVQLVAWSICPGAFALVVFLVLSFSLRVCVLLSRLFDLVSLVPLSCGRIGGPSACLLHYIFCTFVLFVDRLAAHHLSAFCLFLVDGL